MVFGNINDSVQLEVLRRDPKLKIAFDYLKEGKFEGLDSRIDLEEGIYLSFAKVNTSLPETHSFETHRSYYDIHFCLKGQEIIQVAPLDTMVFTSEYKPDIQFGNCDDPIDVILKEGDFCITFPSDAHRPACGNGNYLEKICVKIPF